MKVVKSVEKTDDYDLDFIEKQAKTIMEREGEHRPLAILSSESDIFFIPMIFSRPSEKQLSQKMLRKFIQAKKIERYWIIIEAWVSCNPHIYSASRDIDRKEALNISEFSIGENISGKMVTNFFERDGKKIIWKERVVLEGNGKKEGFYSAWNFYKEDICEDIDDLREKSRIADVVRRVKQTDMSDEIKLLREIWKKDKGKDIELTDEEIKEQFIKAIKKGGVGFKNGVIPKKYRMDTDTDNLIQALKKRRENK